MVQSQAQKREELPVGKEEPDHSAPDSGIGYRAMIPDFPKPPYGRIIGLVPGGRRITVVVPRIVFSHIRRDLGDLKTLAAAALKIKERVSGTKHHFPHSIRGPLTAVIADPASIRHRFCAF
jgi:hypothetical protein